MYLHVNWKIEIGTSHETFGSCRVRFVWSCSSLFCLLLVKVKVHVCELFGTCTTERGKSHHIPSKKKSHPSGQTVTVIKIHCRTRFAQVAFLLPGHGCIFILLPPTSFTSSSSSATNNLAQSLHFLLILDHLSSSSPLARMTPSPSPSTTSSTRLNPLAAPWTRMKRATDSPVLRPCSSTTNSSIRNATALMSNELTLSTRAVALPLFYRRPDTPPPPCASPSSAQRVLAKY